MKILPDVRPVGFGPIVAAARQPPDIAIVKHHRALPLDLPYGYVLLLIKNRLNRMTPCLYQLLTFES
jgi:hypothetical protein